LLPWLFGQGVAPTPDDNLSLNFDLPQHEVDEDVEKICAVSARDSEHRGFARRCASGGGNWNEQALGLKNSVYSHRIGRSNRPAKRRIR
jgi:hypothetical protein